MTLTADTSPVVYLAGRGRLALAIEARLRQAGSRVQRFSDPANLQLLASGDAGSVLVLAADDDAGNVDTALTLRRLHPHLPLVVRVFDVTLGTYLKNTLDNVTLLSMSAIAAPAFAGAALSAIAPQADRSLMAPPRRVRPASTRLHWQLDRVLGGALLGFAALVGSASFYFASALKLPWIDAMYFVWTTVTTVGYGDIALKTEPVGVKIVGMGLMFLGAAFLAVLFAFVSTWALARRLDVLRGRIQVRGRGHIVVAGGGNVGLRVASLLREKEHRVVVIEKDPDSRHIVAMRAAGHHVIVADATSDGILDLAGVQGARAVLVLTNSDAVNLHVALLVKAGHPQMPIVMRVVSPQLSSHVTERRDAVAISPVAVAVDEFVSAALAACDAARRKKPRLNPR